MRSNEEVVRRLFKILCRFKKQPIELRDYLMEVMKGAFYPCRRILYDYDEVVRDALFVSDGYVAVFGFDEYGDRKMQSLLGRDSIVAGKSFTEQSPSDVEIVALPGAYLMSVSHLCMQEVYSRFSGAGELARIIMAHYNDLAERRLLKLGRDSASVILDFYREHPVFRVPGVMVTDRELSSHLVMGESTLRNVRSKLIASGRLDFGGN